VVAARIRDDAQETARGFSWENVIQDNLIGKLEYVSRRQLVEPPVEPPTLTPAALDDLDLPEDFDLSLGDDEELIPLFAFCNQFVAQGHFLGFEMKVGVVFQFQKNRAQILRVFFIHYGFIKPVD